MRETLAARVQDDDGKKHAPIKMHLVGVSVMHFHDAEILEKEKEEMKSYAKETSKNENTV